MAMDKAVKKAFIRYTEKKYPDEAERIIKKADELFPELYAKAPDIGGSENLMAYNLDMFIVAISFYEASDHRMDNRMIPYCCFFCPQGFFLFLRVSYCLLFLF